MSNLPPPSYNGTVVITASIDINAPIEKVWEILVDLPSYGKWNKFVPSIQVVDKSSHKLVDDQTLREGAILLMDVRMPPTDPSASKMRHGVDRFTRAVSMKQAVERVTRVDPECHRVSWVFAPRLPQWMTCAERWQALSVLEDGRTRYENREVFAGLGAYGIKLLLIQNLQHGFDLVAEGLKRYAEEQQRA